MRFFTGFTQKKIDEKLECLSRIAKFIYETTDRFKQFEAMNHEDNKEAMFATFRLMDFMTLIDLCETPHYYKSALLARFDIQWYGKIKYIEKNLLYNHEEIL